VAHWWRTGGALVAHLLTNNSQNQQKSASNEIGYLVVFTVVVCCGVLV
jgi:hypothetical protein